MENSKLILDIRYFESAVPNVDGTMPHQIGTLFDLPRASGNARIARKLRELGFKTGGAFDHLYINFSTALPLSNISFSERSVLPRICCVDFGADPKIVNSLSKSEKETWIKDAIFAAVKFIAGDDKDRLKIIQAARHEIDEFGENTTITHKLKETKTYAVRVSYTIATHGKKDADGKSIRSKAWVDYHDKTTGQRRRGLVVSLKFYEDVYFLISSITVKAGEIIFKPRTSFKASLYNEKYNVPLSVKIAELDLV